MTIAAPGSAEAGDAAFERSYAGTLHGFAELVADMGGDAVALLREAGIAPDALRGCAPQVNLRAAIRLLESAATVLDAPDFGMRLAHYQRGERVFGAIGVVMRNAATLGGALRYAADHIHAYSLAAQMRVAPDPIGDGILVDWEILLDNAPLRSQTVEQILLLAHYNVLAVTDGRARARAVRFRHQPLGSPRTYRDYFGCDVAFDQMADGIVFDADDMAVPTSRVAREHCDLAANFIATNFPATPAPMHAQVRGLILRRLGLSDCKVDSVARALRLHPRTLHRRLRGEARSFEHIRDEVRRDVARYYLEQTDLPFTRISERLGYSETSVLSRSCLRWFGASPRGLRNRTRNS